MNLAHALRLAPNSKNWQGTQETVASPIAFVGAGGKTNAIFQLARQLKPPIIVTATTHLDVRQTQLADQHIVASDPAELSAQEFRGVTLITGPVGDDQRTEPIKQATMFWLRDLVRRRGIPLLVESDGSRQKPLKAPAPHEPAIPDFVETVIVVAGLSVLGKPLSSDFVHRPEIFSALSGLKQGEQISSESALRVLTHPDGGVKNIPPGARRIVLLNQADTPELQSQARGLCHSLLTVFDAVIISSLLAGTVNAVHEPVAGIVLAAGESKRFGRPKQLLDWHGEPFVRAVATKALDAGLSPVVVIAGAHANEVEDTLKDLPVTIVRNKGWRSGQASSIRAGVQSLSSKTGSAIFLLTDQPQVTTTVISALIENHASRLNPIIAPLVNEDRRANPVLFDRVTFPDLLTLEGDIGGRAIFSKHHVEYLPWHDERLLMDVDTPEDYQRLIEADAS